MSEKIFTVVTSNTKKVFTTKAVTVGELKADLEALGISTTGMSIQEGLTKTTFTSDSEVLPVNVPYKGCITSNLVIRITKADKKYNSGATRAEIYSIIKEHGLANAIEKAYGKNYTRCKSAELAHYIEKLNATKEGITSSNQKMAAAIIPLFEKAIQDVAAIMAYLEECKYDVLSTLKCDYITPAECDALFEDDSEDEE